MQSLSLRKTLLLAVLVLLTLAGLTWTNYRFTQTNPGGNDFLPRYVGTRLFLSERQNPYSEETTLAIQEGIYGRPAGPGDDQALFAYPFYTIFIFWPLSSIEDYPLSRAIWMTILQIALLLAAALGISLGRWRPQRTTLIAFLLFAIGWYHGTRPLINGNAAILVALFIALGLWLLRAEQHAWAGLLFALSTIKPQMISLLVPFLLIWSISHRRFRFVISFSLSMLLLLAVSFWLQPGWLIDNLRQVVLYSSYTPPGTPAGILAQWWPSSGQMIGWSLSLLLSLLLIYEWWQAFGKDFDWLLWAAALTLVLTQLVGIPTTTANYASLLLIFPLVFAAWNRRFRQEQKSSILISLGILFVGLWLLFVLTLMPGTQFREHLIMLFPVPIFLLLNLYWLRWWSLRPGEVSYPAKRAQRKR